ncbi:MAG TPA: beta-N-acetylhexosaminidase [Pseudolabrys sp.]|jgi:beta-N-acetylhexosaminidase|nr:beta-N-acetylhexosaminidase [Pseudolabrys sp.]
MAPRAFITGIVGLELSSDEEAFLREADPWGMILFKRNISDPKQVTELTSSFRSVLGRHVPVLVDQEGGRVQRLGPPNWPVYPPAQAFDRLYERDPAAGLAAARLGGRLLAADLQPLGIDVDCLPCADIPVSEADPVIGDRAYGDRPDKVAVLAGAHARGLMNGGVLPVLKHLPGHGRATADSHKSLPTVEADRGTLEATDFAAFRPLARLPLGMTAHVVFSAIDAAHPATTSATMVGEVIRGFIGFEGLLMSDDVSMGALSGTIGERSKAAIAAGCDVVLHCNGKLDEMQEVAASVPRLSGEAARRAGAALAARETPSEFDAVAGRRVFEDMLAPVWKAGEAVA